MPLIAPDYSFLGAGELHVRKKRSNLPFRSVGNCSAFSFSPQTNRLTLPDGMNPGGGTRNAVDRVTEVQFSFTMHDFSTENFADVLRGNTEVITAGNAIDEQAVAYKGGVTPLSRIAKSITAVKSVAGAIEYEQGVDWDEKNGALYVHAEGAIPDPVNGQPNVAVSYAYGAAKRLQALVNPNEDYELLFLGFNEARSGTRVRAHAFKASGGVISELAMLADQYGAGQVQGTLSRDTTRPVGLSQYFTWEQEE